MDGEIVCFDEAGRVLLVQQWRHPVQKLLWSLPAGGMEEGETAEAAVRRELREETGYAAERLEPLYSYHPNPATTNQTFHLFLARGMTETDQRLPGEIHDVRWFGRPEVERMIERTGLSKVLRARGAAFKADVDALRNAVLALSDLATSDLGIEQKGQHGLAFGVRCIELDLGDRPRVWWVRR